MRPAWWRGALLMLPVCLVCVCARPGSAQTTLFLGGGALVPTEGFASVADVGYLVAGGALRRAAGSPLSFGLEGSFGRAQHGLAGERSDLYGLAALLGYTVYTREPISVELTGALGGFFHSHKSTSFPGLDSRRSGLTAGAGATVRGGFGAVRPFLEGRYVRGFAGLGGPAFPTRWVSVTGGISIPLG